MAADLVADELRRLGTRGALVDIGGDIAVRGRAPRSSGWGIASDRSEGGVRPAGGGVATSVHVGVREVLLPGGSSWRTLPVAFGVIAMYLLIAVQTTSLLMKRIPKSLWRSVHVAGYALVWFAIVHAALTGTDVSNRASQAVAMLLTLAAVMAGVLRVMVGRNRPAADRPRPYRPPAQTRHEPG